MTLPPAVALIVLGVILLCLGQFLFPAPHVAYKFLLCFGMIFLVVGCVIIVYHIMIGARVAALWQVAVSVLT